MAATNPVCVMIRKEASRRLGLIGRLGSKLVVSDLFKGSATALSVKIVAVVLNFGIFALLSREMRPDAFGSFAMVFNALSFLASFAVCGQEMLIARSWGEYLSVNRPDLARGALIFSLEVISIAALLVCAAVLVVWPRWHQVSAPLLISGCAFLITQMLMHFSGAFSRMAAGVLIGDGPRQIVWRGVAVVVIFSHYMAGISFSATEFFFLAAAGLSLGMVVQIRNVSRLIPEAVKRTRPRFDLRSWVPCSFKMWLSALLGVAGQYMEVVVVGIVLGPAAAGFYFIATRITNVITMIADAHDMYATSLISNLFYSNNKIQLQDTLRSLALLSGTLVTGAFLTILVAGKLVLSAFGPDCVAAYPALIILAVGAALAAVGGPAGSVLVLTGQEGVYPTIVGAGLALRFILIPILGVTYGLVGVAMAWSISMVVLVVALVITCRRLVGIDPSQASALARWPSLRSL